MIMVAPGESARLGKVRVFGPSPATFLEPLGKTYRMMNGTKAIGRRRRHFSQTTQHPGVPRRSCSRVVAGGHMIECAVIGVD